MGSLPNLHELEEAERKREKRREYELLLEQRARDTSRERERLSAFAQQRKVSNDPPDLVIDIITVDKSDSKANYTHMPT